MTLQLSLFFADVLQALGSVLDIKWAQDGAVYTGAYCTAQGKSLPNLLCHVCSSVILGVVQQIGESGVAISTLVCISCYSLAFAHTTAMPKIIAAHTFVNVLWKIGSKNRLVAGVLVGLQWLFIVLFVAISAGVHHSSSIHDRYDVRVDSSISDALHLLNDFLF